MDHNAIRHKLSEYLDGTADTEERPEIEAHLKTCEKCRNALVELRKTVEHVRQVEEVEPPAWMARKIMATVREEAEKNRSFIEKLKAAVLVKLPV